MSPAERVIEAARALSRSFSIHVGVQAYFDAMIELLAALDELDRVDPNVISIRDAALKSEMRDFMNRLEG